MKKVNLELSSTLGKAMIKEIIQDNDAVVRELKKRLKKTEKSIMDMIHQNEQMKTNFELLKSIPGVGEQVSVHMLLTTYNFTRITDPRKYGSYAGVVPNAHESGTSLRGRPRVSPFANKKVKSLLHMGALTAIKYDGDLKQYYERKVAEGKPKMSVINAVRNKLVHRMYSVIRRQTPYFNQQIINSKKVLEES